MTIEQWMILIGAILIAMGVTVHFARGWPVTTAVLYLAIGFIIGPSVLHWFHFNPLKESAVLERVTEIAVILSLFTAGLKMPVPFTVSFWRYPILMGVVGMALTATLITAFGYYALGLALGPAVLLGGVLAPTDPVLASDIQVRHPGDTHRLRFGLTCEAGINDGTAFPIIMLGLGIMGLHEIGGGWRWLWLDVVWATVVGVGIGLIAGWSMARLVKWIHRRYEQVRLLDNFLSLGLIALVYGLSMVIGGYGFLAVFVAAVALRQTEYRSEHQAIPTSNRGKLNTAVSTSAETGIADRSLFFKEQLEHFSEIVLILIIGGTLFLDSWSWPAVGLALFVFLVARPLGVLLISVGNSQPWAERGLAGWFGIRGIGSLYYLMYAIEHGLSEAQGLQLIHLVLVVVALSIVIHGVTVKPLLGWYQRVHEQA